MAEVLTKENFKAKLSLLDGANVYHDLHEKVEKQKILDRKYGYYFFIWAFTFLTTGTAGYLMLSAKSYGEFLFFDLLFAFFLAHFGGLMHDAGHKAMAKTTLANDILGTFAASILTMNFNAWKEKHNLHHAQPNTHEKDPDVELPIFAFSKVRFDKAKGLSAKLNRYQAYVFYPLTLLQAYAFQFRNNPTYLIRQWKKGYRAGVLCQWGLFAVGVLLWYALPFYLFGLDRAITFVLITPMSIGFYLANIFAPNHKGMPELAADVPVSFVEHQVITSRNINPNWLVDFFYFGLNYQIEHHLFPSCPRINLKKLVPLVKEVCVQADLPYTQVSIAGSQKVIISELYKVSKQK